MKKHRSIIVSILALFAMTCSFAACDSSEWDAASGTSSSGKADTSVDASVDSASGEKSEHVHTFAEIWDSDAKEHWHPATCEHGENKKDLAPHVDVDEDGVCDVCAREVGHTHTFAEEWLSDENEHWHAATCTHKDEVGSKEKHADEDGDLKCDACGDHVHFFNQFGICVDPECDGRSAPVDLANLESIVKATLGSKTNVTGGKVEYKYEGENKTANTTDYDDHVSEFFFGTNGTITKNTDKGRSDGKTYITENHITKVSDDKVTGVTLTTVDGVTTAQNSPFSLDHLDGYLYSVSSLSVKYGTENTLKSLYDAAVSKDAVDFTSQVNQETRTASFSFELPKINAVNTSTEALGGGDTPGAATGETTMTYYVQYYKVAVEFTYDENCTVTSMNIVCKRYTSDAGSNAGEDIDVTYNPTEDKLVWVENPGADTYTFTVTQTVGKREEIKIEDGSSYKPSVVDFYFDKECTQKAEEISLQKGESKTYYMGVNEGASIEMLSLDLSKSLTTAEGETIQYGFSTVMGNEVTFTTSKLSVGVHTCTFTWTQKDGSTVEKTFTITVVEPTADAEFVWNLTSGETADAWSAPQQIMLDTIGTYKMTLYIPEGVEFEMLNTVDTPTVERKETVGGVSVVEVTFTVEGQPYVGFKFKLPAANTEYSIGYNTPIAISVDLDEE